jgi:hypothetical protein
LGVGGGHKRPTHRFHPPWPTCGGGGKGVAWCGGWGGKGGGMGGGATTPWWWGRACVGPPHPLQGAHMALWRGEQGEGTPWGFRVLQKTLGKYMGWGHTGGKEVGKPNTKWKLYKPKSHHPQCTPPLHPTPTCVVVGGAQLVFLKPFTLAQVGGVALSHPSQAICLGFK